METTPRLGMYAAFGFHVPFEERVGLIADTGFEYISLWWEEKHEQGRAFRDLAPPIARGVGLDVESVHVPYSWCNELWSEDAEVRAGGLARHCGWLDDCSRHEVPIMVMHVTLRKTPPGVSEAGLEAYERLVEHGRSCGVVIAVENTRSDEHLDALFAQIDSPYLGLCYDVSHDVLHADEPGRLLREHGDRLVSTHFADTDGILDRHWLPGAGSIDYGEVLGNFPAGYEGVLMLEVTSGRKVRPIPEFVREAYVALQEHVVVAVLAE